MQIYLRKAEQKDCEDLFCWRNDDQARKANFNSDLTAYDTHCEWFEKSLRDPNRFIYIGMDKAGNKIGVVRLDQRHKYLVEFDINIAPEMRGKGYGSQMIGIACQEFNCQLPGCLFLARVKADNPASIGAFKKAGFFEIFDYENIKNGKIVALMAWDRTFDDKYEQ